MKANELKSIAISKQKQALEIYLGSDELVATQDQEESFTPEENNEVENEENPETTTAPNTSEIEASSAEPANLSEDITANDSEPVSNETALEDPRSIEELMVTSEEQKNMFKL